MDIHPPHAPAHSWKDLSIQLATITAGILIALSLEGLREWRHERALVDEARKTIAREIADNLKEVDGDQQGLPALQANIAKLLDLVNDALAKKPGEVHQMNVNASMSELSAAGWQTAERMGALAHMDYSEVQRYSKLYGIQQLFVEHQRQTLDHAIAALTTIPGDPFQASTRDLESFREHLQQMRADLLAQEQIGKRLSEEYRKTLH